MKWPFVLVFFVLASPAFAMRNPASVYCVKQGGTLTLQKSAKDSVGVCVFPDRSYCEEWSYLRGVCKPGQRFLKAYD